MKYILTLLFMLFLSVAIYIAESDTWVSVWMLLFIFLGLPLSFMSLRDLIVKVLPNWLGPSQVLLHLIALFSAVLGYFLGYLAIESQHPKAELHQLMVVIFPAMVYAAPLITLLHGAPFVSVKRFYIKSGKGE